MVFTTMLAFVAVAYAAPIEETVAIATSGEGATAAEASEPDDVCGICLCDFDETSLPITCGHKFHTTCISKWLRIKHNCPLCKEDQPAPAAEQQDPSPSLRYRSLCQRRREAGEVTARQQIMAELRALGD